MAEKNVTLNICKTTILFLDVYVDGVFLLHTLKDVSWVSEYAIKSNSSSLFSQSIKH